MSTILHIIEISYCLMASYFFFIIAEASEQDFKNSVVRTLLFAFLKNSTLLSAGITGKILFRNQIESVVIFTNLFTLFFDYSNSKKTCACLLSNPLCTSIVSQIMFSLQQKEIYYIPF